MKMCFQLTCLETGEHILWPYLEACTKQAIDKGVFIQSPPEFYCVWQR